MNKIKSTNPLKAATVGLCGCEPEELKPVAALLDKMGCVVHYADSMERLEQLVAKGQLEAILVHVCPSRQEFVPILGRRDMPPVIPLLRHADKHLYLQLLRLGAFDCVPLSAQGGELKRVLTLAIEERRRQLTAPNAA